MIMNIPKYSVKFHYPKKNNYALVIPVLNEGERFLNQISKIYNLAANIDLIIIDGGSQDGSINEKILKEKNVNSLLILNDSPGLSSQLRVAYSFCLERNYKGIVTMDGNGKDDPKDIQTFINKLDNGYDYVQGSRYVKGGVSKNTPIDRVIANRFIHAPLLSISSGYCFTDTTNGFRGYSRSFLRNPNVKPFRDIFRLYELLFYLTLRAGQLKLKICEVPVSRNYPPRSPVPTKIKTFSSKLSVLFQLFSVILKKYHP